MFIGREATREVVLARLEWASVFHASTHGRHRPINPPLSGIPRAHGEEL
jgi:hypothetical protein